jgi:diaminopimelate decarboxylase
MSAKNYNSFPEAPEVLPVLDNQSEAVHLIRARQSLEQVYQNELSLPNDILSKLNQATEVTAIAK